MAWREKQAWLALVVMVVAYGAYFVLVTGMIIVGVVMPFSKQGWQISNAALLALVTAEIVRYGVVVASYRRGWHG